MTAIQEPVEVAHAAHFQYAKPATDAAALRDIDHELRHLHEKAEQIKQAPEQFHPKLVLSEHVRGSSVLDKIADGVNKFCGSMYVFIGITVGIVSWLILGQVARFDPVPWPLLLTLLNLPQLSIMISLQVSANRAQSASDKRAIADHETLIALHEMGKQQLDILNGQNQVLSILDNFASKDMPGKQAEIQQACNKILTAVGGSPAAS
jgi:uncharacterized membrane protein